MSGQNKRARDSDAIENERAAFGSSTTTTLPGPLKALVGGRFQPIIDLLAPLPAELQTTIIESTANRSRAEFWGGGLTHSWLNMNCACSGD